MDMMNTRQLYNLVQRDKGQAVSIEFLQICKLTENGMVENLKLDEMRPKILKDGKIEDHGNPLQVILNEGEYLLMVSRTKIVKKGGGSAIRVQILPSQGNPFTMANGQFGNPEGGRGTDYWRFPQIDFIMGLHNVMTSET